MLGSSPPKAAPELELKFQLSAGAVEALRARTFPLDKSSISQLHAVYFDTPGHTLRDGGFSLRVRRNGETYIQTLKHRAGGGLFERDEWETEVDGLDLDLTALEGSPAQAAIGVATLAPAFTVEVERRTHLVTQGHSQIEVSFDTGVIAAGERREAIAEMELELLDGAPNDLFALARDLQAAAALTLSFESKAERGYRLAGHDRVAALKGQWTVIGPDTPGADAFACRIAVLEPVAGGWTAGDAVRGDDGVSRRLGFPHRRLAAHLRAVAARYPSIDDDTDEYFVDAGRQKPDDGFGRPFVQ